MTDLPWQCQVNWQPAAFSLLAMPAFGQATQGELQLNVSDPAGRGVKAEVRVVIGATSISDARIEQPVAEVDQQVDQHVGGCGEQ